MPRRSRPERSLHAPFERPVAPGSTLFAPVVAGYFQDLGVSVAIWTKRQDEPEEWYPINFAPSVTLFEAEYSVVPARFAYNYRTFERVLKTREVVLGRFAGFNDLFIPVGDTRSLRRVLVSGPFAVTRPTSSDILSRWHAVTKTRGRLGDPSFAGYVSATLETLTLEGPLFDAFQRLLTSFAGLVSGTGDATELAAEAEAMRRKLFEATFIKRMWSAARGLTDERRGRTWAAHFIETLQYFGIDRPLEHVYVGLFVPRDANTDPLDQLLSCEAAQREAVALARKSGAAIAGQAGDHGVMFLVPSAGSLTRTRRNVEELARRLGNVARRHSLRLHGGMCLGATELPLPARYRSALAAAEQGVTRGLSLVSAEVRALPPASNLRRLRHSLARGIEARPELLHARLEQYLEAAIAHVGQRGDLKHELDAGLEWITQPLLASGALDEKGFEQMWAATEAAADNAGVGPSLVLAYRKLSSDLQQALEQPLVARHERGLSRAIDFIRDHLTEPITLAQVSRHAGFAPTYFSKLFKKSEGVTFQAYVLRQRIERARDMLQGTKLSIDRVRHLSGFRNRAHFNRAIKASTGRSPVDFRAVAR